MADPKAPETQAATESATQAPTEATESFNEIFSQYERDHKRKKNEEGDKQLEGTVIVVTGESVLLDIGFKSEGILPLTAFTVEAPKPGDKMKVSVKGRDPEGYYELSLFKVEQPRDWSTLEKAFADQTPIMGTVTGLIKGGFTVDVGVRAFMPASRSGVREAGDMEKFVGQRIRCRIIKLDVADEDVVVDRRVLAEEEERLVKDQRFSEIKEGDTVTGTVRSLTDYGAFVDLGGVDALLHVGEISWGRVNKSADVLSVGQQVEVRVLKIGAEGGKKRISVGMKQLQAHPWDAMAEKYKVGERVRGTVTRVMDFGAFVELEPGIEGLIHVSEMSWAKKVRKASDMLKAGETVEAVILGVNAGERRISLGLKQTLGDPWADVAQKLKAGSVIDGTVMSLTKFGAFVQVSEGVEGMIHISEFSEKRINHPSEVVRVGQPVKALVVAVDPEKRLMKLSMKQLIPTGLDDYLKEHKEGDVVTGLLIEVAGGSGSVELGDGVQATCRIVTQAAAEEEPRAEVQADLSSLSSMLNARWKGGATSEAKSEPIRAGQVRTFRIVKLDVTAKRIELELV
jgi:small subunit ribosomal protein S1